MLCKRKKKITSQPILVEFTFICHRPSCQAATAYDLREGNEVAKFVWRNNKNSNLWQNLVFNILVTIIFGAILLPSRSENK